MTARFNESEVANRSSAMSVKPRPIERGQYREGAAVVSEIKALVFNVLNADVDAIYALISLLRNRLVILCGEALLAVEDTEDAALGALVPDRSPDGSIFEDLRDLTDRIESAPKPKRELLIKEFQLKTEALVGTSRDEYGNVSVGPSAEESRRSCELSSALAESVIQEIVELLSNFDGAIQAYKQSDMTEDYTVLQAKKVRAALAAHSGRDASDMGAAVLDAVIGAELLSLRSEEKLDVAADKYSGSVVTSSGGAASLVGGTVPLIPTQPYVELGNHDRVIFKVDGDDSVLEAALIPLAKHPMLQIGSVNNLELSETGTLITTTANDPVISIRSSGVTSTHFADLPTFDDSGAGNYVPEEIPWLKGQVKRTSNHYPEYWSDGNFSPADAHWVPPASHDTGLRIDAVMYENAANIPDPQTYSITLVDDGFGNLFGGNFLSMASSWGVTLADPVTVGRAVSFSNMVMASALTPTVDPIPIRGIFTPLSGGLPFAIKVYPTSARVENDLLETLTISSASGPIATLTGSAGSTGTVHLGTGAATLTLNYDPPVDATYAFFGVITYSGFVVYETGELWVTSFHNQHVYWNAGSETRFKENNPVRVTYKYHPAGDFTSRSASPGDNAATSGDSFNKFTIIRQNSETSLTPIAPQGGVVGNASLVSALSSPSGLGTDVSIGQNSAAVTFHSKSTLGSAARVGLPKKVADWSINASPFSPTFSVVPDNLNDLFGLTADNHPDAYGFDVNADQLEFTATHLDISARAGSGITVPGFVITDTGDIQFVSPVDDIILVGDDITVNDGRVYHVKASAVNGQNVTCTPKIILKHNGPADFSTPSPTLLVTRNSLVATSKSSGLESALEVVESGAGFSGASVGSSRAVSLSATPAEGFEIHRGDIIFEKDGETEREIGTVSSVNDSTLKLNLSSNQFQYPFTSLAVRPKGALSYKKTRAQLSGSGPELELATKDFGKKANTYATSSSGHTQFFGALSALKTSLSKIRNTLLDYKAHESSYVHELINSLEGERLTPVVRMLKTCDFLSIASIAPTDLLEQTTPDALLESIVELLGANIGDDTQVFDAGALLSDFYQRPSETQNDNLVLDARDTDR